MVVSDDVTYADLYEALETVSKHVGRTVNPTIHFRGARKAPQGWRRVRQARAGPAKDLVDWG